METLLIPPAPDSAEETVRFIAEILAQAQPLHTRMKDADAEIAHLATESQTLRAESVRIQTRQQQAAQDMEAAISSLTSLTAHW